MLEDCVAQRQANVTNTLAEMIGEIYRMDVEDGRPE